MDGKAIGIFIMIGLVGLILFGGPDKRRRALAKARAAKKRYARARGASTKRKRTGGKLSAAARKQINLKNLAKARAARRRKAKLKK